MQKRRLFNNYPTKEIVELSTFYELVCNINNNSSFIKTVEAESYELGLKKVL